MYIFVTKKYSLHESTFRQPINNLDYSDVAGNELHIQGNYLYISIFVKQSTIVYRLLTYREYMFPAH
jgi:hypothetical protein